MVVTADPIPHPQPEPSGAAEPEPIDRLELGPGHSLVLYSGARLGAAEQRFQAVGGQGALGTGGHLLLLFRSGRSPVVGVPELSIEGVSGAWRLEVIRASDWSQPSVPAVALLHCPKLAQVAAASTASAVIHLRSGDGEVAAALPATWAEQLGSSPATRAG